jgi:chloramphenicol O-acetyltransferase type A
MTQFPIFNRIDWNTYPRKEQYHYFKESKLSFSTTVNLDVTGLNTALKERGLKQYPAQLWLLTTAANSIPEFRMAQDWEGSLGSWEYVSPFYATLCDKTKSVSLLVTEYSRSFKQFYERYCSDVSRYCNGHFTPQGQIPPNNINISSIPWVDFSSMSFSAMPTGDFRPQLVIGKYSENAGKILMPLSITVSHAVCDGYHVSQFINKVCELIAHYNEWLST